jgi:hypothetical protein
MKMHSQTYYEAGFEHATERVSTGSATLEWLVITDCKSFILCRLCKNVYSDTSREIFFTSAGAAAEVLFKSL